MLCTTSHSHLYTGFGVLFEQTLEVVSEDGGEVEVFTIIKQGQTEQPVQVTLSTASGLCVYMRVQERDREREEWTLIAHMRLST